MKKRHERCGSKDTLSFSGCEAHENLFLSTLGRESHERYCERHMLTWESIQESFFVLAKIENLCDIPVTSNENSIAVPSSLKRILSLMYLHSLCLCNCNDEGIKNCQ